MRRIDVEKTDWCILCLPNRDESISDVDGILLFCRSEVNVGPFQCVLVNTVREVGLKKLANLS